MRWIHKRREPKKWAEFRIATPRGDFDDGPKEELRAALLAEQGYLCCYCMRSIDHATTRIEHRLPRSRYDSERLTYRNLLAACQGGEGQERELQHCDVRKGGDEISIDPAHATRDIERQLRYTGSGSIESDDEAIRRDVNETLNLNVHFLKDGRKEVLAGFLEGFERKHARAWPIEVIERELKKWTDIPPGGRLQEYSGVIVYYLRKRLRRSAQGSTL